MYSQSLRKFVLVDFGIMQSIKENIGEKTRTWREGTPKYMSPDMLSQKEGIIGIVDVYYNDLFGL
jgi:serine/threonine protein kinase